VKLTKARAALIRAYLVEQFPWLTDADEEVSGGDVVEQLVQIVESLEAV
jgi:hypothetical protein